MITKKPGLDKRSQHLELSAKGQKVLLLVTEHVERRFEKALGKLSIDEKRELRSGLQVLNKLTRFINEV